MVLKLCSHLSLNNRFWRPKRDMGGGRTREDMVNYDISGGPGHTSLLTEGKVNNPNDSFLINRMTHSDYPNDFFLILATSRG
jgi:hypothetical protein